MPEEIRETFVRRGVRYSSRLPTRPMRGRVTWKEVYETDSREEVEEIRAESGAALLVGRRVPERIDRSPGLPLPSGHDGTMIWFNQVHLVPPVLFAGTLRRHHFHAANRALVVRAPDRRADRRPGNLRVASTATAGRSRARPSGSIRQTLWNHTRKFDWREGDLLLLDNRRVAHGREPYEGPRVVLASLYGDWSRAAGFAAVDIETFEMPRRIGPRFVSPHVAGSARKR